VELAESLEEGVYDAIVVCVGHRQFSNMQPDKVRALGKPLSVLYDVKHIYSKQVADGRL
jgi:UDP-N-acetyl-D-galactosamine dehydrogenase